MQKVKLVLVLLIVLPALLRANPVDDTPIAKFSELVFDTNSNWTMEIIFPYQTGSYIDSIVFKTSSFEARYSQEFTDEAFIYIITSDSLSIPLNINRSGDKISIYTYSNLHANIVREDSIIFGNLSNATVGAPVDGYSIIRIENTIYPSHTIDALTTNHSLGVANSRDGLSGTLTGYLYDKNNASS